MEAARRLDYDEALTGDDEHIAAMARSRERTTDERPCDRDDGGIQCAVAAARNISRVSKTCTLCIFLLFVLPAP